MCNSIQYQYLIDKLKVLQDDTEYLKYQNKSEHGGGGGEEGDVFLVIV